MVLQQKRFFSNNTQADPWEFIYSTIVNNRFNQLQDFLKTLYFKTKDEKRSFFSSKKAKQAWKLAVHFELGDCMRILSQYGVPHRTKDLILCNKHQEDLPLYDAIRQNDVSLTEQLLNYGAEINANTINRGIVLHYAVHHASLKMIKYLLEYAKVKGILTAVVNVQNNQKDTPLHNAVKLLDADLVAALLHYQADLTVQDIFGNTALYYAVHDNHYKIVNALLKHAQEKGILKVVVNTKNKHQLTPLHAAIRENNVAVVMTLLKHGAELTIEDDNQNTLLHYAVYHDRQAIVKALLKHAQEKGILKVVINAGNNQKQTALQFAVAANNKELVDLLLDYQADLELTIEDCSGNTALHYAVSYSRTEIVKRLLGQADKLGMLELVINAQNNNQQTPLHVGVEYYQDKVVEILLQVTDNQSNTLKFPTDTQIRDKNGYTAADNAKRAFDDWHHCNESGRTGALKAILDLLALRGLLNEPQAVSVTTCRM